MNADRVYLTYILECITNIEDLTRQGRAAFEAAKHNRAALLYYLQTLSETTQRVSESLKTSHSEIDWVGISGFRNRLVHGYLEVNMDIVWGVIENALPGLKVTASAMLRELPHENDLSTTDASADDMENNR